MCMCIYDCLGSQRVTEPEFDEGTAVVSKGGWGMFLHITLFFPKLLFLFVITSEIFLVTQFVADFVLKNEKENSTL